jgi:hypothetical protein
MVKGQVVTALLYGGSEALRRVVADKGDVVVICSDEEYNQAEREGREPSGVGFPREDVMEKAESVSKKTPTSRATNRADRARAGD